MWLDAASFITFGKVTSTIFLYTAICLLVSTRDSGYSGGSGGSGNKYTINHVLNSNNTLLNMYYVSKQVVNL